MLAQRRIGMVPERRVNEQGPNDPTQRLGAQPPRAGGAAGAHGTAQGWRPGAQHHVFELAAASRLWGPTRDAWLRHAA